MVSAYSQIKRFGKTNDSFHRETFSQNGPTAESITCYRQETVTDFIFLGSKITADGDCSHKIKRPLFLGRKAMASWVAPRAWLSLIELDNAVVLV